MQRDAHPRRRQTWLAPGLLRLSYFALSCSLSFASAGCGSWFGGSSAANSGSNHAEASGLELQSDDNRPRLALIERASTASAALAVVHDFGPIASASLAGLVEGRLLAAGYNNIHADINNIGFVITLPFSASSENLSPKELSGLAESFVRASHQALTSPVRAGEPGLLRASLRLRSLSAYQDPVQATLSQCHGGLSIPDEPVLPALNQPAGITQLESWRKSSINPSSTALSLIGPAAFLDAGRSAHASLPSQSAGSAIKDVWPSQDQVQVGKASAPGMLSIGVRTPQAASALEIGQLLEQPGSALRAQLAQLGAEIELENVVASTRPRGGCVLANIRVDALGETLPSQLVLLTEAEIERAAKSAPGHRFSLDEQVLYASDPRELAAQAAWRSLVAQHHGSEARRFVGYRTPVFDSHQAVLDSAALKQAQIRRDQFKLPVAAQLTASETSVQLLLATACAPSDENTANAGSSALWVQTLAHQAKEAGLFSEVNGRTAQITPWISGHGVGLLISAHRQNPDESQDALVKRAAELAARSLTQLPNNAASFYPSKQQLLNQLGGTPDPGWQATLDALSPNHPSRLDPRGAWQQLNQQDTTSLELRRQALLSGPWRVAALSGSKRASQLIEQEVKRWLWPHHQPGAPCHSSEQAPPKPGLYRVTTSPDTKLQANAWVVAPLPNSTVLRAEAEYTVHLLNGPRGWLKQTLAAKQLSASAEARLLGGSRAAALIIAVQAEPSDVEAAVQTIREALGRLSQGAATQGDVEVASRHFEQRDQSRAYDPQFRTVQLWLGRSKAPPVSLVSLRSFQHLLAPERHIVTLTFTR